MNAERLEIARRFAACPGWVFLPGMQYMDPECEVCMPDRVHHVEILRSAWGNDEPFIFFSDDPVDFICARSLVPDLDDELTRLGCLAVVRRAWGRDLWAREDEEGGYVCETLCKSPALISMERFGSGPSELLALLAALEAAPK